MSQSQFVSARQPGGRDKTARDSGNALTELNWAKVLATASRYDFTFSASAGFDESVLFASLGANGGATCAANPPGGHRSVKAAAEKFSSPFGKTSGPVFGNMFGGSGMGLMFGGTAAAAAGTTDESPFAHLRKGQVHATDTAATTPSIRGSVSEEERVQEKHAPDAFDDLTLRDFVDPGFEVLKTFTPDDLDVLYHASVSLDGDAVVRFTKGSAVGRFPNPPPRFTGNAPVTVQTDYGGCSDRLPRLFRPINLTVCPYIVPYIVLYIVQYIATYATLTTSFNLPKRSAVFPLASFPAQAHGCFR